VAAPLGHGRACPGHPDNRALCHPDRDRRDKPGEDATSFAPVARNVNNILSVIGDSVPPQGVRGAMPAPSGGSQPLPPSHQMRGSRGEDAPASAAAPIDARQKISSNPTNIYLRQVEGFGR
jgi:hypothetical protein